MKRILSYGPVLQSGLRDHIRSKSAADMPGKQEYGYLERLERFAVSGKLLRGSVLCFSYEAFSGNKPDQTVFEAAMALELTHSGLLIHDDIMDGDDRRRGRPSMHRQYELLAEREGLSEGRRFGINMALAGGDAALFMAFELMMQARAARTDQGFYGLFIDQLLKTCAGQMQDIYLEARPATAAKRDIYALMRTKTAAYTLALPLTMGAALAGQPEGVIRRLRSVGTAGGTIFQIRDDELGALGDPEKTGKPVGADIREGKQTLLRYYLQKACVPAERLRLKDIFGNPAATEDDILYVQGLTRQRGVPAMLAKDIGALQKQASPHIARLPVDPVYRQEFINLVDFCARRQY